MHTGALSGGVGDALTVLAPYTLMVMTVTMILHGGDGGAGVSRVPWSVPGAVYRPVRASLMLRQVSVSLY